MKKIFIYSVWVWSEQARGFEVMAKTDKIDECITCYTQNVEKADYAMVRIFIDKDNNEKAEIFAQWQNPENNFNLDQRRIAGSYEQVFLSDFHTVLVNNWNDVEKDFETLRFTNFTKLQNFFGVYS